MKTLQKYIPQISLPKIFSFTSPYVWFIGLTFVLLVYVLLGNNNEKIFLSIFNLTGSNGLLDKTMIFAAAYMYYEILFLVAVFIWKQRKSGYMKYIVGFICMGVISYILSKIGAHFIHDTRPYIQYKLTPLMHVATDNGFPSDHTLLVMCSAVFVSFFAKKTGWFLFVLAILVGFARVYVAAHHPLDVIGSMAIVLIASLLFIAISSIIHSQSNPETA